MCCWGRALVKNVGLVLLNEPLANLDYKLREELRAEIPRIFEQSGAIFVYATTEPEDAFSLGGDVAIMREGRATQGRTPKVYREPCVATTVRVFLDPPMNVTRIEKTGDKISFGEGQSASAQGALTGLADGDYTGGLRPDHLHLSAKGEDGLHFLCHLNVTEITGSETFAHLSHGPDHWVGLLHGVQDLTLDAPIEVWLDLAHVYVFDAQGKLVAPAAFAMAA